LGVQAVNSKIEEGFGKPLVTACLIMTLSIAVFGASTVLAEQNSKKFKDERLGHYTLEDESMLGRYGDVNDEWTPVAKVQVSQSEMTQQRKRKMPKKDSRLGAFSMQDDAMLGAYGDKNDE
jgi:uncharacterized protein YifE (UPF0438 family)